jgi:hypothetical protein
MKARVQFHAIPATGRAVPPTAGEVTPQVRPGALGGTRTPNLLIRSQMLYPLSYERRADAAELRHRLAEGMAVATRGSDSI